MAGRIYPSARGRILDAAERVILADGLGGLSVESVMREAKVSKGGFFHHFASKELLLAAMTERLAGHVGEQIEALAAKDRHPRGKRLRAQVQLALEMPAGERERLRALVLALIIAAMEGKAIAARARAANQRALADAAKDGVPIGPALVIQVALDGYWLAESLGTLTLDVRQKAAFRQTLLELANSKAKKERRR